MNTPADATDRVSVIHSGDRVSSIRAGGKIISPRTEREARSQVCSSEDVTKIVFVSDPILGPLFAVYRGTGAQSRRIDYYLWSAVTRFSRGTDERTER